MNRRKFLELFALGVAGHTLDIDRLLWVPGQKTIFVPTQAQVKLYASDKAIDLFLAGIQYHHFNASTREWLGFNRDESRINNKTSKVSE